MNSNNLYNASKNILSKNTANTLYNNAAENKIIENAIENANNKEINDLISSGQIIGGLSKESVNVKNITNISENSYNLKEIIDNDTNIINSNLGKKFNYTLRKKEINFNEEKEPTKVNSDPDKPIDSNRAILTTEQIQNAIPKKKYKFSINKLYSNTRPINVNSNNYINTLNKEKIDKDFVISQFNDGIIVENPIRSFNSIPTYKMITSEYLEQETTIEKNEFNDISINKIEHKSVGQDTMHHRTISYGVNSKNINKCRYNFSLDNISVSQNLISKTAGFISQEIDVSNCGWIEIECDNIDNIEFYILEEKNETPILPKNVNYINNEKLFYGLMPRFTIKDPDNITVYKNGELTAINNLDDLCLFLCVNNTNVEVNQSSYLQENEYTVSYRPDTSAKVYYPNTDKIRIKVIKRNLNNDVIKDIGLIKIYKYNNSTNWTLASYMDDRDCAPYSPSILS